MYGLKKPDVFYEIWASGQLWDTVRTLKAAQKSYTEALSIYEDTARDSVFILKVQKAEVIRGRYF